MDSFKFSVLIGGFPCAHKPQRVKAWSLQNEIPHPHTQTARVSSTEMSCIVIVFMSSMYLFSTETLCCVCCDEEELEMLPDTVKTCVAE